MDSGSGKQATKGNDDDGQRQEPRLWPLLLVLLVLVATAAASLYYLYKLTAVPRLQVCDARVGPLVFSDPLNRTIAEFKLNIRLCWK